MTNPPANCTGCGSPIRTVYCIAGLPDVKYCSRSCVDKAFEAFIQGRRRELRTNPNIELAEDIIPETDLESEESSSTMETTISKEFGDAAIVRHVCDRKGCGKPVTLGWKGRDGEYCSNECLKSERVKMTTETNTVDMTDDDDSPVTAGKSTVAKKKKKGNNPKAAKAAKPQPEVKAKSSKAKTNGKANANGASKIGGQVIHLTKTESDLRGKRAQIYKLMKNGMTVSQLQEDAAKKLGEDFKTRALVVLRLCVENNLCTVK